MKPDTKPVKVREFHNHHFDSTIWNDFNFRDDDIIISTYAKSGTTWMQQIVSQLLFKGEEALEVANMSPWMDLRFPPKETKLALVEAQKHRRFLKTHLPVDALVFSDKAKYIYIGRDGRDVLWSMYNHHATANEAFYEALNHTPGRVGPPMGQPASSVTQYFHEWLDMDGYPWWPFWENVRSWWEIRNLPNVLLVHFANLKSDLPTEIRRIAKFLDIPIEEKKWNLILNHCDFDYMKKHAKKTVPLEGTLWNGGAQSFIHKGVNGRWRDTLTDDEIVKYEEICENELGHACAHWLISGELPAS